MTVGCIEVPREEAIGLRRDAGRRRRTASIALPREAERPARPCPAGPTAPWPAWASTSSTPTSSTTQLRRDARRARLQPRLRQGHHPATSSSTGKAVAHRFARSCVTSSPARPRPTGATSARVDAYWEANLDLTDVMPELNLYDRNWPIWTYAEITAAGQVRPRRGRPARQAPSTRWSPAAASSRAPGSASSLLFTDVRVDSYCRARPRGDPARRRDRPRCQAAQRGHRPRRAHPARPGRRRGPRARRPPLPAHREGACA